MHDIENVRRCVIIGQATQDIDRRYISRRGISDSGVICASSRVRILVMSAYSHALTRIYIAHAHIQEQAGPEAMKTAYDSDEDIFIACICAAISFVVYMMTLYPRVPGGDSGELIAAAYQVCC